MIKPLRVLIQIVDDGSIWSNDAVEYQDKLWLVPEWIKGEAPHSEKPARLISLDGLPLQKAGLEFGADFLLPLPLDKATLGGATEQGLEIVEAPDAPELVQYFRFRRLELLLLLILKVVKSIIPGGSDAAPHRNH